ncbi:MAG: transposase [Gloeocapsa sp. UFS-A4-WI-NPMV-4B04]|jgi:transposase-like protein|nr:transposase [Gloeocapsa sp. UFS-A4-WI-NPMV-4B04]
MTVKKLSDSDKQEILNLYRHTGETTSTLAERYGVSNSTISRFLKSTLQEEEYESLIQQKRAARTSTGETTQTPLFSELALSEPEPEVLIAEALVVETKVVEEASPAIVSKRLRQRTVSKPEKMPASAEQLQLLDTPSDLEASSTTSPNQDIDELDHDEIEEVSVEVEPVNQPKRINRPISVADSISSSLEEAANAEANTLAAQMLGEDLLDDSEELADLEDDEEDEDEEDVAETPKIKRRVPSEILVQVLPLSEANLPKTCYLVIDRASELITRPLRDFGDLGQIPSQEDQQKTLPVFDNHRVARRFSTKRDRVIKVPDSRMLQKARSHLQAKGITRLLVDGQVYSLSR